MSKKIAIMSSDVSITLDSIAKFFKESNYNVEITCISDYLNSDILKIAKVKGLKNKYLPFEQNAEYFATDSYDLILLDGYEKELSDEILTLGKFVEIHPSLLPSFKGKDAVRRAYLSGVKVSGVTISYLMPDISENRIIAQYPILLNNSDHFDEFQSNIFELEKVLVPKVIKSVLEDTLFDYNDLLKPACPSTCGSCQNCNH